MNEEMKNRVQRGFKGGGANEWSWRDERELGEGRRRNGNWRGKKRLAIGKEGEGKRRKVKEEKLLKLSVHSKKFGFEKVNKIFFFGLSVHS